MGTAASIYIYEERRPDIEGVGRGANSERGERTDNGLKHVAVLRSTPETVTAVALDGARMAHYSPKTMALLAGLTNAVKPSGEQR